MKSKDDFNDYFTCIYITDTYTIATTEDASSLCFSGCQNTKQ